MENDAPLKPLLADDDDDDNEGDIPLDSLEPIIPGDSNEPRRRRGRPPGRRNKNNNNTQQQRVSPDNTETIESDDFEELNSVQASAVDFDSWINQYPWDTGAYTVKIRRQAPTEIIVNGKSIPISGWLGEQTDAISEAELSRRFGGRTLIATVVGPDKKGKIRALGSRQIKVAGEPILAPSGMPYQMWQAIRPQLIEAGMYEENNVPSVEQPLNRRHPRQNEDGFSPPPYMYGRERSDRTPQADPRALQALQSTFKDVSTLTQRVTERALDEKDKVVTQQVEELQRQREANEKRMQELQVERDKAERERDELRNKLSEVKVEVSEQMSKTRAEKQDEINKIAEEKRRELDKIKEEKTKEVEETKKDAERRSEQAVSANNRLFEILLPAQVTSHQAQMESTIRSYEARIDALNKVHEARSIAAEQALRNQLETAQRQAETQLANTRALYDQQIQLLSAQLRSEADERKRAQDRIEQLRDSIQTIHASQLAQQSAQANPHGQLEQMKGLLGALSDIRGITASWGNNGNEPTAPVPAGSPATNLIQRALDVAERTIPDVARAWAVSRQNAVVAQQQQQVQQPQQAAIALAPQVQAAPLHIVRPPVQVQHEVQEEQKEKPKVKREILVAALQRLSDIYTEGVIPEPQVINSIARTIKSQQDGNITEILSKVKPAAFIKKLIETGILPVKLNTENGHEFLSKILLELKTLE